MVQEKLQEKIWQYCPPILVWFGAAFMIWRAGLADWPLNEQYYIASEVLLAASFVLVWVLVFYSWGFWLKHSPRLYRDEVYSDVRKIRNLLDEISVKCNSVGASEYSRWNSILPSLERKLPSARERKKYREIYMLVRRLYFDFTRLGGPNSGFTESEVEGLQDRMDRIRPKIDKLMEMTDWVYKK